MVAYQARCEENAPLLADEWKRMEEEDEYSKNAKAIKDWPRAKRATMMVWSTTEKQWEVD